jgi:hypothetical protein
MEVTVIKGILPDRDVELNELPQELISQSDLSIYQKSASLKVSKQKVTYQSRQGSSITPIPLWAVEFKTVRRKSATGYQILPKTVDEMYVLNTARWATNVTGTGTEKQKWRGLSLTNKCSISSVFAVVTSSWLVPFAIAHRYLVYIPVELDGDGPHAKLVVRHDFAQGKDASLEGWLERERTSEQAIKHWTMQAQRVWIERKTERSPELVTKRLDYHGTLSTQEPKAYRVVHTRSRSFYSAVLDPIAQTGTGLPFNSIKLQTIDGEEIIKSTYLPINGVICDNLLHSIVVNSKEEAYWLTGLFNSQAFGNLVMKEARGEPPGIYSLPVKILESLKLKYAPENDIHLKLAALSMDLESKMYETIQAYFASEKNINLLLVDDTDRSPEIPSTISSALMRRLNASEQLHELEDIANEIIN